MEKHQILRQLPGLDSLLQTREIQELSQRYGTRAVTEALRQQLDWLRQEILTSDELSSYASLDGTAEAWCQLYLPALEARIASNEEPILRPLINATGVLLHTNLGRAPLGELAARRVYELLRSYSNLEYDLEAGRRGVRYQALEPLLCRLTGSEAALVVNNNAAAVLMILNEFGAGGEAIVSRGELVEIGGAFRVPDIMQKANCRLHEVGTTNKTHLYDYERAINEETKLLLKVHKSNFRLIGFSEEVELPELRQLANEHQLPLIYDLGSGLMHPAARDFLPEEPTVQAALAAGVDIVSFSGDKLLGGPQAGIILGKKEYIDRLKKNPYTRAFRIDKMVVAALEMVLRSYLDPERIAREVPIFNFLSTPLNELQLRSDHFIDRLGASGIEAELVESEGEIGGGSAPGQSFPSWAISISAAEHGLTAQAAEMALRRLETPIIGCIRRDCLLFDLRCVAEREEDELLRGLVSVFGR